MCGVRYREVVHCRVSVNGGSTVVKIRGAKMCHTYVLHLSSWKYSLNGITKIPYYSTCMYMTIYIIIILIIKPNYLVCTEK